MCCSFLHSQLWSARTSPSAWVPQCIFYLQRQMFFLDSCLNFIHCAHIIDFLSLQPFLTAVVLGWGVHLQSHCGSWVDMKASTLTPRDQSLLLWRSQVSSSFSYGCSKLKNPVTELNCENRCSSGGWTEQRDLSELFRSLQMSSLLSLALCTQCFGIGNAAYLGLQSTVLGTIRSFIYDL